jgi:hypothetical protein
MNTVRGKVWETISKFVNNGPQSIHCSPAPTQGYISPSSAVMPPTCAEITAPCCSPTHSGNDPGLFTQLWLLPVIGSGQTQNRSCVLSISSIWTHELKPIFPLLNFIKMEISHSLLHYYLLPTWSGKSWTTLNLLQAVAAWTQQDFQKPRVETRASWG